MSAAEYKEAASQFVESRHALFYMDEALEGLRARGAEGLERYSLAALQRDDFGRLLERLTTALDALWDGLPEPERAEAAEHLRQVLQESVRDMLLGSDAAETAGDYVFPPLVLDGLKGGRPHGGPIGGRQVAAGVFRKGGAE